jgi:hypothetical protein
VTSHWKAAGLFARRLWAILVFLCGILLLAMTTNVFERMFVYFPAKELEGNPSSLGLEYQDLGIVAEDGVRLHGWFVPRPGAQYTLLVFHVG